MHTAWQPSRYGDDQRLNIPAMVASMFLVAGFLAAFITVNVTTVVEEKPSIAVFDVFSPPVPPAPPPPPKAQPKPVEQVKLPSPIVAPPPVVRVSTQPAQLIATAAAPVVSEAIAGPASAEPQVTIPIESVGDISSTMISAPPPRYPHESRRKREQGTVQLLVLLAADGSVANIEVARTSGFVRLDQAALSAVRRWKWSPVRRGGVAVMVRGLVEIPFILQDR